MKRGMWVALVLLLAPKMEAQTIAADSLVLARLSAMYIAQDFENMACLAVHQDPKDSLTVVVDSVLGLLPKPPCPQGTNGLAGVASFDVTREYADTVSTYVLQRFPDFELVCAIFGVEYVEKDRKAYAVPKFWCKQR